IDHLNDAAIATWKARMVNEYGSHRVFDGLYQQLSQLDLSARDLQRLKDFAEEERGHGILCGAVVEALGGEAIAPALPVIPFPKHEEVGPLEGALRNLLSISCLSETIAVSLIGAERLEMPEGELKELLTKIYAEECGHANFGWRLLGDLLKKGDAALCERLNAYLKVAFAHLEQHELAHLPIDSVPPPEGVKLGLCSGVDARVLFYATVEQVIIPGLEKHGLNAQVAWDTRKDAVFQ
ncbi:MAG: ferritin-like domain-containing protein, partial [Myxococcota bacterium]|nr:ferritin-like domain-containing protein [Myxococcota bacterium]